MAEPLSYESLSYASIKVTPARQARILAELASVYDKVAETLHRCPRLPEDGPDAQLVAGLTRREWEIAQFALKWVGGLITIEGSLPEKTDDRSSKM